MRIGVTVSGLSNPCWGQKTTPNAQHRLQPRGASSLRFAITDLMIVLPSCTLDKYFVMPASSEEVEPPPG